MVKSAAFLLIKTNLNSFHILKSLKNNSFVKWANAVFGPYQVVAYAEAKNSSELTNFIEDLRTQRRILELDARMCKQIPGDEKLKLFKLSKSQSAVLLINVNYRENKERNIVYNLRKMSGIVWSRAMWGPTDIVTIVEAKDHETMRNLICDDIKTMKGVMSNTTLYCYPDHS